MNTYSPVLKYLHIYLLRFLTKFEYWQRAFKPENILIDDIHSLQIKLTDFGFAAYFDEKDKMDEVLGSPLYMPPEIVKHEKYASEALAFNPTRNVPKIQIQKQSRQG